MMIIWFFYTSNNVRILKFGTGWKFNVKNNYEVRMTHVLDLQSGTLNVLQVTDDDRVVLDKLPNHARIQKFGTQVGNQMSRNI